MAPLAEAIEGVDGGAAGVGGDRLKVYARQHEKILDGGIARFGAQSKNPRHRQYGFPDG
jgi:hypothetical protein